MSRRRICAALSAAPMLAATILAAPPAAAAAAPSGTVVWTRFTDGFHFARLVGIVDGNFRILTSPQESEVDVDADVAPDGRHILFERDLADGRSGIGLVGTDGKGEHLLDLGCTDPCAGDLTPSFTPDGQDVLFTRVMGPFDPDTGDATSAALWQAHLDGSGLHRVSDPEIDGVAEDYHARFAPAGYIVFLRQGVAGTAVFRMNADGTHVRRLTPYALVADIPDVSPAVSGPTEDLVVFETFGHGPPDGAGQSIATVPATCRPIGDCAAKVRILTPGDDPEAQNFNPAWSPNGQRIVFTHFTQTADSFGGDIWTMNSLGGAKDVVSADRRFEFRPAWGVAPRR